ncbi:hypothetical protein SM11_pC1195 (plasmid) [Sinorhizobium meliloti SM11]|uniref:Uncharacterized protein n=1 Tax=Sinorhizobium meliloti (strain SM11) TaxID=707241 RepID=F7XFE3_SINMM|nr:hypothetical protein SM11_pC1195 [Sinorhizobium meliloti SM11]
MLRGTPFFAAGLPCRVPTAIIDRQCASGLSAIATAANQNPVRRLL